MATKKPETPLEKIVMARSKLRMYVQFGDVALDGQSPQEFAADVQEAFLYLLEFRNMVAGMAALEESPSRAVEVYID